MAEFRYIPTCVVTLKALLIVGGSIVLLCAGALAAEEEISTLVTGETYQQLGPTSRVFYVMGVVEGMQLEAAKLKFQPDLVVLRGCVGGRSGKQLAAIVDKYVAAHPELWHKPMSTLVYSGVIRGCEEASK